MHSHIVVMSMQANVLNAFTSINAFGSLNMAAYSSKYLNRINSVGEQLEYYVKDAIAGSLTIKDKDAAYNKVYSYLGNQNNPPDIMIKGGDAFEIKKINGYGGEDRRIALNSSPPKDRLYSTDPRITDACRNCEPGWKVRDIFYAVGQVYDGKVNQLLFVQGRCYAAEKAVYEGLHANLKSEFGKVIRQKGLQEGATVELGRVNRVDPLGITELRVRGMWQMKNPLGFFEKELNNGKGQKPFVAAVMLKSKYNDFPEKDRKQLEGTKGIEVKAAKLKNPNNPADLLDGIVIKMVI